jgi:hypothetical protein
VFFKLQLISNSSFKLFTPDLGIHLHEQKDVGRSGNDLVQLDDVRMPEQLHVLDFPPDFGHAVFSLDLLTVDHFHGHVVTRQRVFAFLHLFIGVRRRVACLKG